LEYKESIAPLALCPFLEEIMKWLKFEVKVPYEIHNPSDEYGKVEDVIKQVKQDMITTNSVGCFYSIYGKKAKVKLISGGQR
jgi:hypothetical protein